jgi:hypothetical protein
MNAAVLGWLAMRAARWLLALAFLGYSLAFIYDRSSFMNEFNHLYMSVELTMFGLGLGALFAGFLELMMREKAGFDRPKFGQLIPPKAR